jgi:hypothetical protein
MGTIYEIDVQSTTPGELLSGCAKLGEEYSESSYAFASRTPKSHMKRTKEFGNGSKLKILFPEMTRNRFKCP